MSRIYTIGHSTRTIDELIELLQDADIDILVDIRSYPGSRRYPHFNKEYLEKIIPEYIHIPSLGGRRRQIENSKHIALEVPAFQAYADWMETEEFAKGLKTLENIAKDKRVAFMCSEIVHWKCHRRMVSDILTVRGWKVFHLGNGSVNKRHKLWDVANVKDGVIVYDKI